MDFAILADIGDLPDHRRVLKALLYHFRSLNGVVGAFSSGSLARREMDEQSDLDLGILVRSAETRDAIWSERWNWPVEPWFHRFDADHIRSYFVIYLFEPCVKADLNLYVEDDLPRWQGAPFEVIWSDAAGLTEWCEAASREAELKTGDGSAATAEQLIHDDERVWAWLVYVALHAKRGEYYSAARAFGDIRDVVENWSACLEGAHDFSPRGFERRMSRTRAEQWAGLFPQPSKASLKEAFCLAAEIHLEQRAILQSRLGFAWRTSEKGIRKVRAFVREL